MSFKYQEAGGIVKNSPAFVLMKVMKINFLRIIIASSAFFFVGLHDVKIPG